MNDRVNDAFYDSSQVVIVEASAGSGKTYSLAKRYITLLLKTAAKSEYISLREILAITFTNKAVIEMKERILELLKRIAFNTFESPEQKEDILSVLGADKGRAKPIAIRIIDELIRHYNFFQVQTIDSFINTLLLGSALNIERSASFQIKRDYLEQLSYCLDLVIEQGAQSRDVFSFLEEFLKHYLFVENKSGWFPKKDILELTQSLFRLSNKYGELFQANKSKSSDVLKKKNYVYQLIKELELLFPKGLNGTDARGIRTFLNENMEIFNISSLPMALAKTKVPMNKGKTAEAGFQEKWERARGEIKELVELDSAAAYNPYVRLFLGIVIFFQAISKKEDVVFLEELNRQARLLFGDEGVTVAEIYYRLAARFKHYLIDEFQDTSILQWYNLKIMVEEALSTGGTLFYVGDKKQAIYRFRGGEAKLFDSLPEQLSIFNIEFKKLSKNWRSQKAIVEFNNKVFSKENLMNAINLSGIAAELSDNKKAVDEVIEVFKDAAQEYKEENCFGYVKVEYINEKDQSQRDEIIQPKIIELLKELKKRFEYEDIAVLTRDNNEVELVSSWLLEEGIPVESEKTLNIAQNPLIKGLISFLKFLYSPIDNLSFASFILSELFYKVCGLSYQDIEQFIFIVHKERPRKYQTLYRLFRQEYPDIWQEYISGFLNSVGFISPYELVVQFYARFQIAEHFSEAQAFFMKFLELIKAKEDEYAGLSGFLTYFENASGEDLYVHSAHSNAVKILTIHKSKGLEFGVVIIPFLRMDINPETGEKSTSSYVVGGQGREALELKRITKNHRLYSRNLQEVYAQGYKKACIDELNKIYVALTRAQYELYIFVPTKSASKNNKARFIVSSYLPILEIENEIGSKRVYVRKKSWAENIIKVPPSKYEDLALIFAKQGSDADKVQNREKIIQGVIFHFILSFVNNLSESEKETVINQAVSEAENLYPLGRDFSSIKEKISLLVDKEELKSFFYVSGGKVFNEKEIVNNFGDIKRIDRLVIKEKQAWVIDYKLSKEGQDKHSDQVLEYMRIIKGIYPKLEVKGFIIYLDEMFSEEQILDSRY
ncbi:MAG: UvrD-helicase domain-containing protein [Candidatus Omnitrophota bacterium]